MESSPFLSKQNTFYPFQEPFQAVIIYQSINKNSYLVVDSWVSRLSKARIRDFRDSCLVNLRMFIHDLLVEMLSKYLYVS